MRDTFQIAIPVRSFFAAPTVAGLAELLVQTMAEQAAPDILTELLADSEELLEGEARTLPMADPLFRLHTNENKCTAIDRLARLSSTR
jgi:hypothetical protein